MTNKHFFKLFSFALCFMLLSSVLTAQISASDNDGCAPLTGVVFTGPSGASNILWNFGDGATSNLPGPSHTFSNPGTYTVTYTATVSGSPVNYNLTITVFPNPTANFTTSTPRQGCIPLNITFQDASTGSGGTPITTWNWTFGDGATNNGAVANPTHPYSLTGSFNVILTVIDANGCQASVTQNAYVSTSASPIVNLTHNPTSLVTCTPPFLVNFNAAGTSPGQGATSITGYSWNFGNGNTSTAITPPAQNYTNFGTYPVTLTVTNNLGCSTVVNKTVLISNPILNILMNDTICQSFTAVDSSSGNYSVWTYDDGTPNVTVLTPGSVPTHTYTPGWHTINVTNYFGNCTSDTTINVYVQDVIPSFTSAPVFTCHSPNTVQFTNTSQPTTALNQYNWTFTSIGNPSLSSTAIDTSYTFSQNSLHPYTVYENKYVTVILQVTTPLGCTATKVFEYADTIRRPTAFFNIDDMQGCAPHTVNFEDSSFSRPNIIRHDWYFGDGSSNLGNTLNPSHTYTVPGIYQAYLIIENADGCIDTSFYQVIYNSVPITPSFTFSPASICVGDTVTFINTTPAPGIDSVDTWHYSSDNGFMSGCIGDPNASWQFTTTGTHSITLTSQFHGCEAQTTITNAITVKGPAVAASYKTTCEQPNIAHLIGQAQDADSVHWAFGDGIFQTLSAAASTSLNHTYPAPGTYTLSAVATNPTSGCPNDTQTVVVNIYNIKSAFTHSPIGCSNQAAMMMADSSKDVFTGCFDGYFWYVDNRPPVISATPITPLGIPDTGYHTIALLVKDANGCRDTSYSGINIYDVHPNFIFPDFSVGTPVECLDSLVNFSDQSTSDTTNIVSYNWDFNDTYTATGPNVSHAFNTAPTPPATSYSVTLTITNEIGCSRSKTLPVIISVPKPTISLSDNTLCTNVPTTLTATQTNNPFQYHQWNFGDGTMPQGGTSSSITHGYAAAGTYTAQVWVTDSIGCIGTSNSATISVQAKPTASFIASTDTMGEICYPVSVSFTNNSTATIFQSLTWNLGNGSNVLPQATVGTTYTQPGDYSVSLGVYTTYGCYDDTTRTITVNGPLGNLTLSDSIICKGESITFNLADTTKVAEWNWDFGDGNDTVNVSPISHTYLFHPPSGTTIVSLNMWSEGHTCPVSVTHNVYIQQVVADFTVNGLNDSIIELCFTHPGNFVNTSQQSTTFNWSFGDGSTGTGQSPISHNYAAPGTYLGSITIGNPSTGCVDTLEKTIIVHPLPLVITHDTATCANQAVPLSVSGAGTNGTYIWTPSTGLSCDNCPNPVATLTTSATYSVTSINEFGCSDSTDVFVGVIEEPQHLVWDTTVIIGEPVQMIGDYDPNYIYSWTPNTSLNCTTCYNPIHSPAMSDITFNLHITDIAGCFDTDNTYHIRVEPKTSIDVPQVFTPNGDGVNDIVYVEGWGIKKLVYFRIYNRYGQLIFESNDMNVGWDGNFNGVPQNIETYVYEAKAETYVNEDPKIKKGHIKLMR